MLSFCLVIRRSLKKKKYPDPPVLRSALRPKSGNAPSKPWLGDKSSSLDREKGSEVALLPTPPATADPTLTVRPHVTGGARRREGRRGCSGPLRRDGKGTGDTELPLSPSGVRFPAGCKTLRRV